MVLVSAISVLRYSAVGKTTLGTLAAKALGWELLDTDHIFEKQEQMSISDFITKYGWEDFRKVESQIVTDILQVHHVGKVIATGGGVIELEANRALLQRFRQHGPVIHVLREKDAVLDFLRNPSLRFPPLLHETAREAWTRREKYFRECCSFEFVSMTVSIPEEEQDEGDRTFAFKTVEEEFFRLLRFIHGVDCNKVPLHPRGARSYCLALTYDDYRDAIADLEDISLGIDLWEVRADLLLSQEPTFIAFQIATLRRHSSLPILFTLRTVSQGGKYPNDGDVRRDILYHALTLGIEYIDLEIDLPNSTFSDIKEHRGNTTLLVSYQDFRGSMVWNSSQTRHMYDRMVKSGAEIVKIAGTAKTFEDNMGLRQFVGTVERNSVPLLAFNMGPEVSRPLLPLYMSHLETRVKYPSS